MTNWPVAPFGRETYSVFESRLPYKNKGVMAEWLMRGTVNTFFRGSIPLDTLNLKTKKVKFIEAPAAGLRQPPSEGGLARQTLKLSLPFPFRKIKTKTKNKTKMISNKIIITTINILISLIDVLVILLPVLLSVAFMTIIERKQLAAHQRRVGPNYVGYFGILQPFSDALKLIFKETIVPSHSNKVLFYLSPVSTLIFSLLGWGVIPFGQGLVLSDFSLCILYTLALSSLGVYGILFSGWSANSKYAFLGSLRSTASMISYELILSSAVLIIILLTGSFNFTTIIEQQQSIWFIVPLLPVFIFYFISILAETSRTPFDLQEAESELVAGFFTEHSSVPFVFFFLAEYSSIVLFSTITAILFLGGYNLPEIIVNNSILNLQSIILGLKTCIFCFMFVWFRATLPRMRYDALIELCWLNLLPVAVAFIILVPSILVAFDIAPY